MDKVITIYQAKTHFSKLVRQAQAGKVIYIGAYGHPQAIIAPVPAKKPLQIGVWADKKKPHAYKDNDIIGPDPDITADFNKSLDRPL